MKSLFFFGFSCLWTLLFASVFFNSKVYSQSQTFEEDFNIQNLPEEFLPSWYGNELRATSSRIFQVLGKGRNESKGLAVQPISTFDGEVVVKLSPSEYSDPKAVFWASSLKNGSGNRPAVVLYAWSESLEGAYGEAVLLDQETGFPNEDREFRKFELAVPESFKKLDTVYLKFYVNYGPGSGSCARWVLDDFEFGDIESDSTPPSIFKVNGYDEDQVLVHFSEPVDPIFSVIQLNYKLEMLEPVDAQLISDSTVLLTFSEELLPQKNYRIEVSQIPDLAGNFMVPSSIEFQFFDPTEITFKDLVINELMPAPKPDLDLPNVEYVELYHVGDYVVRLEGLIYGNSRNEVVLDEFWLEPGEYLLLVPESQKELMKGFGNVLPIKSWPTLLNSGDQILLKDSKGKLIDQLSYTTATWGGSEFSGGGFSLEVTNPFISCEQTSFLKSSIDPLRGTPGRENSIFDLSAEIIPPVLEAAYFLDSVSIVLEFSQPVRSVQDAFHIEISDLDIDSVFQLLPSSIQINLKGPAIPSLIYELTLNQLADCYGSIVEVMNPIKIVLPENGVEGDVGINELLFNPQTGRPKFVEIFNKSNKYIALSSLVLGNVDDEGKPDQFKVFSNSSRVLPPKSYLAITTDTLKLKADFPKSSGNHFIQIPSLPSYPISGGTVILATEEKEILETFKYDEKLHHPLLRDPKGVSLERVSADSPSNLSYNWQSASSSEDYGTPGKRNSQDFENEMATNLIQIDPEVFDPEGSNGKTFTTISYELDQPGWVGSFEIFDISGRLIYSLGRNVILGPKGIYTWEGTDEMTRKVRPGYYILLVELFDLEGEVIRIKKTIVVATRF